jgi:hypothetical protein
MAERWHDHPVAACNPFYWACWLLFLAFKLPGRWSVRLGSCNRPPDLLGPTPPDERDSSLAFELKQFWIVPFDGFFVLALVLSIVQVRVCTREATSARMQ